MKLKNQVCSLELSKKLKELGVEQKSIFWWGQIHQDWAWHIELYDVVKYGKKPPFDYCSAFTLAELWAMMPADYMMRSQSFGKDSVTEKVAEALVSILSKAQANEKKTYKI